MSLEVEMLAEVIPQKYTKKIDKLQDAAIN